MILRWGWILGVWLRIVIAHAAPSIEIEQIEVEGIRSMVRNRVESALELAPGSAWDQKRADRSLINLKALLAAFGYSNAKLTQNFRNRIWEIKVEEGEPTRVRQVLFNGQNVNDSIRQLLGAAITVQPGEILTRDRLEDLKRRTEKELQSTRFRETPFRLQDAYIMALSMMERPRDAKPEEIWVDVEMAIVPTERVTFGFRGNQRLSQSELSEIVDEQRTLGGAQGLEQRIANRIAERYRAMAYAQVKVEYRSFERRDSRHYSIEITEGPRVELEAIRFDGQSQFDETQLRRIFNDHAPLLTGRGYFVASEIEQAAEGTVDWIRSQGFLSARVVSIHQTFLPHLNRMRVLVYLYEGDRTLVRTIKLNQLRLFSEAHVRTSLGVQEQMPLNLFDFSEGLERLKQEYRDHGYLNAKIANESSDAKNPIIQYSLNNRFADVEVEFDEGPEFRVGTIEIEGTELTDPSIVRRELTYDEGNVLEAYKIPESESRIRRLGIFTHVQTQLRSDATRPDVKHVRVTVGDSTPGLIAGGLGVRNDLGLRAFGSISYSNLWRQNHTLSLSGSVNRRFEFYCRSNAQEEPCFFEFQFRIGYLWPWFLFPRLSFRPELSFDKRRYIQFDSITTSFTATFERAVPWIRGLSAALTYSLERTKQFNAASSIDNKTLTVGALTPSLKLDRRDDPLSPSSGYLSTASFEYAASFLGSQVDPFQVGYTKFQFRTDVFIPLLSNMIWYLSFRTGYERNLISSSTDGIPLIKQFALGGPSSLRGYRLQEVNVQDILILGSLAFVNYRSQIDFPITQNLRVGPFLDVGALVIDGYNLFPSSARTGVGFGLHYQTPIGPFNIDWGFKIDPRVGEDPNRIDVTIGLI